MSDMKESGAARLREWEEKVLKPALEAKPDRPGSFTSRTGIPIARLYTPLDVYENGYLSDVELPGEYPFTRGRDPIGYRHQFWVMGQYSGFGTAEETNERFRYLIEQGQTGFSIALDLPTQIGLDSDDPLARGEVGKVGVAIDSLADFKRLFAGIDLRKVRQVRTSANCIGPIVAAMFIALAEENDMSPNDFSILLQNDSLKEYPARGTWIFPPRAALKLSCDVIEYTARHLPRWNPIQFCGAHYREAGGTAVQELAFAFADAIAYIEETRSRGLHVDAFAGTFYLFVYVHTDFLEEVAKLRAARRIWAKLLRERYGSEVEDTWKLNIFVWVGGSSLTAQQPLNNIVRVSIQALAAVMGGVQTLATASYDEALAIPSSEAVTVALRTQQIIAHESGAALSIDPLGGSYMIEALTDDIERQVMQEIEKIDAMGGAVAAIESGYFNEALTESAHRWHQQLESGEKTIVGQNAFVIKDEKKQPVFQVNPAAEQSQVDSLKKMKASRDNAAVRRGLDALRAALKTGENLVPVLVPLMRANATIGEVCDVMREHYGEYRQAA